MDKQTTGLGMIQWEGDTWLSDPEESFGFRANWKVKRVLHREQSDFQEVAVMETVGFGRALVLDGIVQTTEKDAFIYNEMITHIPLAAYPDPKRMCIIGGGDCGAARETMKYPGLKQVDMVEIDPKVVEVSQTYLPEIAGYEQPDPRIQFHYEDGAAFVQERKGVYDVISVDSSDPVGPAAVLFEKPFYQDVHRALTEDGIMVCQSESPIFHPQVLKRVHHTLKELFPVVRTYLATVPTYPGGIWSFTLASKKYDPLLEGADRLQMEMNRYVDRGVYQGCFQLPVYVQQLLKE
ncbi:polyamine aminopropyltransferase [Kroppenstedtia pulmonis]|uniref:Polyamine aminopropyltransferase n=1 Tax=Kroppenstedtia pulmonis TaxID=1380685 RepID=A0A7D4BGR6_9BACL|nr:polyamine aminopropyltransferase [Kroppenstedtia pulmonis]QKG85272.1 polyamine aminopropyltransferase [Kroppenstedtia pulmonis]